MQEAVIHFETNLVLLLERHERSLATFADAAEIIAKAEAVLEFSI
ncbi:MAG: hypothetical protein R3F41_17680 [Gammaproteobacteria bacterium]